MEKPQFVSMVYTKIFQHTGGWKVSSYTANTKRSPGAGLMLAQRLRRWPNIKPAPAQRLVFTGWLVLLFSLEVYYII